MAGSVSPLNLPDGVFCEPEFGSTRDLLKRRIRNACAKEMEFFVRFGAVAGGLPSGRPPEYPHPGAGFSGTFSPIPASCRGCSGVELSLHRGIQPDGNCSTR